MYVDIISVTPATGAKSGMIRNTTGFAQDPVDIEET